MKDYYDNCPLVNRGMGMGECYDVQMVASGLIKDEVLDFKLNRKLAEKLCEDCEFNQFKQK